jgi:hypothetical protein
MAHNALGAHARDESGISEPFKARPIQTVLALACKCNSYRAGSTWESDFYQRFKDRFAIGCW